MIYRGGFFSTVFGIIIGILLSYIVWFSRRRCLRNKNPEQQTIELDTRNEIQANPAAETVEADSTYQEPDLTKGNICGNDSRNDDDSAYTELNKVRDVEDNYQSLT